MKNILIIALVGWTFWAGHIVVAAGYWFGVLLPIAGLFLLIANRSVISVR